ncbi:hypothetical protein BU16DRAFT_6132 [Lophium mytilinum]|uniref:Uncharacterized protein n=1 Tax=Lophium mytilinum TaxID=390894 RepID=A0A6A6RD22_9PEZI|nr:hypothetical protein BU16DRAFT_6132 [Lophium mytilinum]
MKPRTPHPKNRLSDFLYILVIDPSLSSMTSMFLGLLRTRHWPRTLVNIPNTELLTGCQNLKTILWRDTCKAPSGPSLFVATHNKISHAVGTRNCKKRSVDSSSFIFLHLQCSQSRL